MKRVDVVKAAMYLDPKPGNKAGSIIGSVQLRGILLLPVFLWRSALSVQLRPGGTGFVSRVGSGVPLGCPGHGNSVMGMRHTAGT